MTIARIRPAKSAKTTPTCFSSATETLTIMKKHTMPQFLDGVIEPAAYERWLKRKVIAHVKRDKNRGHSCTAAAYRDAIHAAVLLSGGNDAYTGERLDWELISTYNNEDSKVGRHAYKAKFGLLPTVDHVSAEANEASFKICGWRTNDAKHDMSVELFMDLCTKVLRHAGFRVHEPS